MLVRPTSDFRLDRWGLEIVCNLVATVALRFRLRRIYLRVSSARLAKKAGINSY